MYDIISWPFWRYSDIVKKGMISYMIKYYFYDIISQFRWFSRLSCSIFLRYCLRYHIHIIQNLLWSQNYMLLNMILPMIWPSDICITWYHSHTISQILWCYNLYHGTCAAGWRGLEAPGARRSTSSVLAIIANVLGTCVQLNGDGFDPTPGLIAVAAARVVHHNRFVVIEKSRLAAAVAAGCAAHAGNTPMHRARWQWDFKYGFGVKDGFKLETRDEKEKKGGAGEYSLQYLKARTPSQDWTWSIVWQTSHAFWAAAAFPNLSRVVRIPWPASTATKGF
jgi:hypothetical protein